MTRKTEWFPGHVVFMDRDASEAQTHADIAADSVTERVGQGLVVAYTDADDRTERNVVVGTPLHAEFIVERLRGLVHQRGTQHGSGNRKDVLIPMEVVTGRHAEAEVTAEVVLDTGLLILIEFAREVDRNADKPVAGDRVGRNQRSAKLSERIRLAVVGAHFHVGHEAELLVRGVVLLCHGCRSSQQAQQGDEVTFHIRLVLK